MGYLSTDNECFHIIELMNNWSLLFSQGQEFDIAVMARWNYW